ncbi:hypothetical protein ACFQU2_12630 [Siccirubricoccus deserti]|nr:hypothetical protein [Siccirubricoccus deserti]
MPEAALYVTVRVSVATAICSADADSLSWIKAADTQQAEPV